MVLALVLNDLKQDWKRPWSILLLLALPIFMPFMIASVFGGRGSTNAMPALHVAIMDQDKDLLSRLLRSLPTQGDAAQQLRAHFVDTREEGLRLVEKSEVSALIVLPKNMTQNLLDGKTNAIELYENPSQQIMPKVVRQGVALLAVGLSGAAEILHEPLKEFRDLAQGNDFPADAAVLGIASDSVMKLRHVRTYLFPPIIQFTNVAAADYRMIDSSAPIPQTSP